MSDARLSIAQLHPLRAECSAHRDFAAASLIDAALAPTEEHDAGGELLRDLDGNPITRSQGIAAAPALLAKYPLGGTAHYEAAHKYGADAAEWRAIADDLDAKAKEYGMQSYADRVRVAAEMARKAVR